MKLNVLACLSSMILQFLYLLYFYHIYQIFLQMPVEVAGRNTLVGYSVQIP